MILLVCEGGKRFMGCSTGVSLQSIMSTADRREGFSSLMTSITGCLWSFLHNAVKDQSDVCYHTAQLLYEPQQDADKKQDRITNAVFGSESAAGQPDRGLRGEIIVKVKRWNEQGSSNQATRLLQPHSGLQGEFFQGPQDTSLAFPPSVWWHEVWC